MNLSPLSSKNYRKSCLSALVLTLILSGGTLPVKAQTSESLPKTQIAQSSSNPQSAALQQKAEQIVQLLGEQQFAKAQSLLTPELQANWSPDKIRDLWEGDLISATGQFVKILRSQTINIVNADVVKVTVEFEKRTDDILLTFNKNQQVIGVNFPQTKSIEENAQEFISALGAKDYAKARGYLHPALKTELFPQQIQQKWERLLKQAGNYKRQVGTEVRKTNTQDGTDLVLVTIQFDKLTEDAFLLFDNKGRIVGVDFPEIN